MRIRSDLRQAILIDRWMQLVSKPSGISIRLQSHEIKSLQGESIDDQMVGTATRSRSREGATVQTLVFAPPGRTNAGQYHTHGADSKGKNWDYVFSNSDMSWAEKENVPSYLGIPDGRILKYTPIPGTLPRSGPAIVIGKGAK